MSAAGIDPAPGWSRRASLVLTAAPLALVLVAWAISAWGQTGWYLWTGIIVLGVLVLAFSTALALAAIGRWLMRGLRRRATRLPDC